MTWILNPFLLAEAIGWSCWRNVMLGGPALFPGYNSSNPLLIPQSLLGSRQDAAGVPGKCQPSQVPYSLPSNHNSNQNTKQRNFRRQQAPDDISHTPNRRQRFCVFASIFQQTRSSLGWPAPPFPGIACFTRPLLPGGKTSSL